jgi:predicted GNAT family acetyltransferase
MKDTTAILNIAYKECESKIKNNMNGYKKFLSKFMSNRSKQLYSNMPSEQIYFTATDVDDFFNSTGINKEVIKNAIDHTYYAEISNFNPRYAKDECTIAMLCLVRYFRTKNDKKDLELALISMAFSGKFYPSIWYRSFPVAAPQEHVMDYVINNMCNNKFDIVREGNVIGAIKSVSTTWLESYGQRFKDFHDDDCAYLVQQLHNRIGSFMTNIAELYYEAYDNKDLYMTYDSDDVSEDNYRLADSDVFRMERIVSNTMYAINTHGINYKLCKMASNNDVKMDELKSIIENIMADNKNVPLIKEFVTLMVACYFQQSNTKDVKDLDFVSFSIKPKPNSKNKYVVRQKELLNLILINNSEHFTRRRSRGATESSYYRSINAYFALLIQESNK